MMEKTLITKLELSINKSSLENGVKNRSRRETRQTLTRYNNAAIKYSDTKRKDTNLPETVPTNITHSLFGCSGNKSS